MHAHLPPVHVFNRRRRPEPFSAVLILSILLAFVPRSHARTWIVEAGGGGDTESIQMAILLADEGDTIQVGPGIYRESVFLTGGRSILLHSRLGPELTIIDGEGVRQCLQLDAGIVDGFTVRNGFGNVAAGVAIGQWKTVTSPVLRNCIVEGNRTTASLDCCGGAGIYSFAGGARIENNVIRNNETSGTGGGILEFGFDSVIVGNFVAFNLASGGGGIWSGSNASIVSNMVVGNFGRFGGGGISVEGCAAVRNNTIVGNSVSTNFASGAGIQVQTGFGCAVETNLVVDNHGNGSSTGMGILLGALTMARCNNVWGNDVDTLVGGNADESNFSADPLFCATDPLSGQNFSLRSNSPCLGGASPTPSCPQVGAQGVGCATVAVRNATWGSVKRLYR